FVAELRAALEALQSGRRAALDLLENAFRLEFADEFFGKVVVAIFRGFTPRNCTTRWPACSRQPEDVPLPTSVLDGEPPKQELRDEVLSLLGGHEGACRRTRAAAVTHSGLGRLYER